MSATATAKTYRAESIAEALAAAKKELGPQAVVLSARELRRPGLLGAGRPLLELLVAPSSTPVAPAQAVTESRPATPAEEPASDQLVKRLVRDLRATCRESEMERAQAREALSRIRREIGEAGATLRSLIAEARLARGCDLPPAQITVIRQLVDNGIEPGNAEALVRSAPQDFDDPAQVRSAVARFAVGLLRVAAPPHLVAERTVAAFVGPTGVGKTTTVAKIAAHAALAGRTVGLITTDTYRIGAVDQLRAYAELLHAPLCVVEQPQDWERTLRRLQGCSLLLVDSGGRSFRAREEVERLAELLPRPLVNEIHLVLPAAISPSDLRLQAQAFAALRPDRLLWTKLDECAVFGALLNGFLNLRLPCSYLSTGQRVPEDLEVATPERIGRLLLASPPGA
ncbi:MAG: flagellar biosynthesis protein FlhF [Myxococcales bacterium]|nr:flagellar biosynthesis protein FlhF [Myxococcales bacterium]